MNSNSSTLHDITRNNVFKWLTRSTEFFHARFTDIIDPLRNKLFIIILSTKFVFNYLADTLAHHFILKGKLKTKR